MNKNNSDFFNVLRNIANNPESSQRSLAKNIGFSLGKLNYLIRSLAHKGLIKINNFKKSDRKFSYIYVCDISVYLRLVHLKHLNNHKNM